MYPAFIMGWMLETDLGVDTNLPERTIMARNGGELANADLSSLPAGSRLDRDLNSLYSCLRFDTREFCGIIGHAVVSLRGHLLFTIVKYLYLNSG